VRHPNAVEVFDCGIEQGVAWLAMEFLEGEDLGCRLEREGVLAAARPTDLMLPVIAAVAAAHEQDIVHRDLKPENIFLAHTHVSRTDHQRQERHAPPS
jgi:serine/threonine protein kinase